jgi:hypothetical protein
MGLVSLDAACCNHGNAAMRSDAAVTAGIEDFFNQGNTSARFVKRYQGPKEIFSQGQILW